MASSLDVVVLTSLYPSPKRPFEGIFAERRWLGMSERGHRVRVIQPTPRTPFPLPRLSAAWAELAARPERETRGTISIERPRYTHLPKSARSNARRFAARGLACLGDEPNPDVVVCDYAWPAAASATALELRRIPCVVSGRGSDILQVEAEASLAPDLAAGLRSAGHWCAVSQDLVDAMDRIGGRGGQGVLVPNGVDTETFRPRERSGARAELGLSGEHPIVLVVGHLIPRKDPLLALEAFAAGAPPAGHLHFVGMGALGHELEDRARQLGIGDRVHLEGESPPERLRLWYGAADLLLLCSSREGRPNVVLEALASGRPVVATEAGGTGELLSGLEGALVRSRSAEAIGAAIRGSLSNPPDSETCRAQVADLSWDASLDALEGCLNRAIEDCDRRSP